MNYFFSRVTVILSLVLMLTACPDKTPPPPPPDPQVVIPQTTKVADVTTRTALSAFDLKTGTMRFSQNTSVLQNLQSNSVLVGEPSSAAPYGYLRKIKSITNSNGQTILETTQANLTDAISKGSLNANGTLKPTQLHTAKALRAGVTPRFGNGFDYEVSVHTVYIPDSPGKGEVHIDGFVRFNLGYHVGLDISGCFDIPPVCLDKFEASAGFDQQCDLKITGNLETPLKKDIDLAEYAFDPIIFFIGPVPVVIVPKVTLSAGIDGQASVQFSYSANERATLQVGARWTDGHGWENISDKTFNYFPGKPEVQGKVNIKAAVSMEGQLLLYDVAGPGLNTQVGLSFDAAIPRNPVWILSAFISEDITFVVDLPVIGKIVDYSTNLLEWNQELARSPNNPPSIKILQSIVNASLGKPVQLGNSAFGTFTVSDLEDGSIPRTNIHLTSDKDGALTLNSNDEVTFSSQGSRQITVTATDSAGANSSATFTVNVINTPPVPFGIAPGDTVQQGVAYFISAGGTDAESGRLGCDAIHWSVTAPDTFTALNNGAVCVGKIIFNLKGLRTVRLTATDPQGLSSSKDFQVTVTDPPLIPPPDLGLMSIKSSVSGLEVPDQAKVYYLDTLGLSIPATDPGNLPLSYTWSVDCLSCSGGYKRTLSTNPDGGSSFRFQSGDPSPFVSQVDWKITVTVSNGKTSVSQSRSVSWYLVIN